MKIMVADDERVIRESLQEYLQLGGAAVVTAEDGLAAQRHLEESTFDAAVVDLKMPGQDGLQLLAWIRDERPRMPVIMISAFGEVADAVAAMKLGADDYVVKPFDPEELAIRLTKLVAARALRDAAEGAQRVAAGAADGSLGASPLMLEIERVIGKVAPTATTVLITGESGTGKELVAQAIHQQSGRGGPFIAVNAGGIPDALLESELFGYEKGAFTGAESRKSGMFELAGSGTLFLDEIGEMPGQLQVKLLRAVQERKIQRLGGAQPVPIDARLLAASNRDLESEVAEGRFREDLYYRLNVVRIRVPPLRDRLADLELLAGRIIHRLNRTMGIHLAGLTAAAYRHLRTYAFPGNVRELENLLERAAIFADSGSDTIDVGDLDLPVPGAASALAGRRGAGAGPNVPGATGTLKESERVQIEAALARWDGNRTRAAEELGITRRTLFNRLREYGQQ